MIGIKFGQIYQRIADMEQLHRDAKIGQANQRHLQEQQQTPNSNCKVRRFH